MIVKFYLYLTTVSVTIHTSGDAWPMAFYFFESDMLFNPKQDLHVQVHNRKYVHLGQLLKGVVGSSDYGVPKGTKLPIPILL